MLFQMQMLLSSNYDEERFIVPFFHWSSGPILHFRSPSILRLPRVEQQSHQQSC
jgi:hypothetical protein